MLKIMLQCVIMILVILKWTVCLIVLLFNLHKIETMKWGLTKKRQEETRMSPLMFATDHH